MTLDLDRDSPLPIQEQITAQLRALMGSGELRPGEVLPTIKTMAVELGVNPNTVASAYRTLEAEGYLVQRKRAGTRVAESPPLSVESVLAARLAGEAMNRARAAGLGATELLRALAGQGSGADRHPKLRVAVLAASELEARTVAARAEAILGDGYVCYPVTPERYDSIEYHLSLIDPQLTERLTARAVERPLPTHLRYGPEFPSGAD